MNILGGSGNAIALDFYTQPGNEVDIAFDQEDIIIPPEDPDADPDDPASMETIIPRNIRNLTKKLSVDNAMLVFLAGYTIPWLLLSIADQFTRP